MHPLLLGPVLVVSKIFGLFPAGVQNSSWSRLGLALAALNMTFWLAGVVYAIKQDDVYIRILNERSGRVVAGSAVLVIHALWGFLDASCLVLALLNARAISAAFLRARELLARADALCAQSTLLKDILAIAVLVLSSVPHIVTYGMYLTEPHKGLYISNSFIIYYIWIVSIPFLIESQFVCLCFIVEKGFKAINLTLTQFKALQENPSRLHINMSPIMKRHSMKYFHGGIGNLARSSRGVAFSQLMDYSKRLRALRKLAMNHLDLAENINRHYGIINLFNSVVCRCNLVLQLYLVISYASSPSIKSRTHEIYLALQSAHLFLRMCYVSYRCEAAMAEADRTTHLLVATDRTVLDPRTRDELDVFQAQLSVCKVSFSASGFFGINLAQITNIVATTTTYIVILIQFQKAD